MDGKRLVVRTCVGCGVKRPVSELIRFIRTKSTAVIESTGVIHLGRGAYLCAQSKETCLIKAVQRRSFERALPRTDI